MADNLSIYIKLFIPDSAQFPGAEVVFLIGDLDEPVESELMSKVSGCKIR